MPELPLTESIPFPKLEGTRGGGASLLLRMSFYQILKGAQSGEMSSGYPQALKPLPFYVSVMLLSKGVVWTW